MNTASLMRKWSSFKISLGDETGKKKTFFSGVF